jgi:hypothetical protein
MLTKLKYVGVRTEDLIDIYVLFIRSLLEYCCVVWHSSLIVENQTDIERVQKTCLKVILGEMYVSYHSALEMTGLKTLSERREDRCLDFAKKCLKNPRLKATYFPSTHLVTNSEREKDFKSILLKLRHTRSPPSHTFKGN